MLKWLFLSSEWDTSGTDMIVVVIIAVVVVVRFDLIPRWNDKKLFFLSVHRGRMENCLQKKKSRVVPMYPPLLDVEGEK